MSVTVPYSTYILTKKTIKHTLKHNMYKSMIRTHGINSASGIIRFLHLVLVGLALIVPAA